MEGIKMSIFDELRKQEDFECSNGASSEKIEEAEAKLGVKFPEDYRIFLEEFGYASWFGHFICGISENTQYNVVDATLYERTKTHGGKVFPLHCIAIDTDCLMFCEPSNAVGRVQVFMTGVTPEEQFGWNDFFEFLRYKLGH